MIKQYTTIIKKTKQDKDLQSKRWRPREMWRQVRNRKRARYLEYQIEREKTGFKSTNF